MKIYLKIIVRNFWLIQLSLELKGISSFLSIYLRNRRTTYKTEVECPIIIYIIELSLLHILVIIFFLN